MLDVVRLVLVHALEGSVIELYEEGHAAVLDRVWVAERLVASEQRLQRAVDGRRLVRDLELDVLHTHLPVHLGADAKHQLGERRLVGERIVGTTALGSAILTAAVERPQRGRIDIELAVERRLHVVHCPARGADHGERSARGVVEQSEERGHVGPRGVRCAVERAGDALRPSLFSERADAERPNDARIDRDAAGTPERAPEGKRVADAHRSHLDRARPRATEVQRWHQWKRRGAEHGVRLDVEVPPVEIGDRRLRRAGRERRIAVAAGRLVVGDVVDRDDPHAERGVAERVIIRERQLHELVPRKRSQRGIETLDDERAFLERHEHPAGEQKAPMDLVGGDR